MNYFVQNKNAIAWAVASSLVMGTFVSYEGPSNVPSPAPVVSKQVEHNDSIVDVPQQVFIPSPESRGFKTTGAIHNHITFEECIQHMFNLVPQGGVDLKGPMEVFINSENEIVILEYTADDTKEQGLIRGVCMGDNAFIIEYSKDGLGSKNGSI